MLGVGVSDNRMSKIESILNCQGMQLPFKYLGIPVGANFNRVETWELVLDNIAGKLTSRKHNFLSFGGRICLIK